jgi:hypothetical protein
MSSHEHLLDADLLAVLLAARPERDTLALLRACPVCGPELAELERDIAHMRSALAESAPAVPAQFAARVLAHTTREDLGLLEDARLILAFVGARLRSSRALRVAAASLLLHLLALPVLAFLVLREPEPRWPFNLATEEPPELHFEPALEPEPELVVPEPETPQPRAVVPGDEPERR